MSSKRKQIFNDPFSRSNRGMDMTNVSQFGIIMRAYDHFSIKNYIEASFFDLYNSVTRRETYHFVLEIA